MTSQYQADVIVAGGGLAGIVTALELLRAGKSVIIVDRDTPERFGGLARWAFGGMALVGTPLQKKMKINDTPEMALRDWLRFGEVNTTDKYSQEWARYYVEHSRREVYDWLIQEGLSFLPAVNWVERGRNGEGNSVPRYHIVWGTSRELTLTMINALHRANRNNCLTILHQHRVTELVHTAGKISGVVAINEQSNHVISLHAPTVVLAMGGINGAHDECRRNWPHARPLPTTMLNGAHPFADGRLHHHVAEQFRGELKNASEMWNYAAGFPHPYPHFEGHGLSTIPCKSALWLNHKGERLGPEPLITGFDTHWLCHRVAEQEKPWTWHLLNWRIAIKEFAISGAEHNQRIRDKQFFLFLKEMLLGNHRLVNQMKNESRHFLVADTLAELASKMNQLTCSHDIDAAKLQTTVDTFDALFNSATDMSNDEQIRRIMHARQWKPDRLRTCTPKPLQMKGSGPFIAIQMQLITRKSLGGLTTDLHSRVLNRDGQTVEGLYCVGEAAGFGGGGAHGKRSLEGTFLPSCIMTAKAAARSIIAGC